MKRQPVPSRRGESKSRDSRRGKSTSVNTGGGDDDAEAEPPQVRLHTPSYLRIAIARLLLCSTPGQALSVAARMRGIPDGRLQLLHVLEVVEAAYPIAIDALCLLGVSERGLQENELCEMLGC